MLKQIFLLVLQQYKYIFVKTRNYIGNEIFYKHNIKQPIKFYIYEHQ